MQIDRTKISVKKSTCDFLCEVYLENQKDILFWDTCGLLEIIRFIYRRPTPTTLDSIMKVHGKIVNGEILSMASEISIDEWNENIRNVSSGFAADLEKTTKYHADAILVLNKLVNGRLRISEALNQDHLEDRLLRLAMDIIDKTHFIEPDEIARDALTRVRQRKAPSKKNKQEFKDCAIWETANNMARQIQKEFSDQRIAFYTVNTEDFAETKDDGYVYKNELATEAATHGLECFLTIDDVAAFF